MKSIRAGSWYLWAILSMTIAPAAEGQAASGAQALLISPSVRDEGMGRSGTAVFWGSDPNYWANPAFLGYESGFRYEHSRAQLVPDLADDVFFTTDRLSFGRWGIGIAVAGQPIDDLGGLRLDYGWSIATDENGVEIGRFRSWEKVRSVGVGVSLAKAVDALARSRKPGGLPVIDRFGDLAIGRTVKTDKVFLAPKEFTLNGIEASGEVDTGDFGLLVRLTPFNSIDPPVVPSVDDILRRVGGLRCDASYGHSVQNMGHEWIVFIDADQRDPVAEVQRDGVAIHLALGFPPGPQRTLEDHGLRFIPRSLSPLVAWGMAWSDTKTTWPLRERTIHGRGWELILANIVSIRRGHIEDRDGWIIDDTSGWGIGIRLSDLGGFRVDRATVPQARGLEHVHKKGYEFYVDPFVLWRVATGRWRG